MGAVTISPPTKRPCDTLTQAQFTHGPPLGPANKQFVVAWGGPAVDGTSLLHGPLRVDRNAETEKKANRWAKCGWMQRQGTIDVILCTLCIGWKTTIMYIFVYNCTQ